MIQDLHSHTRYSNCGRDEPALVVEAAIQGGIDRTLAVPSQGATTT